VALFLLCGLIEALALIESFKGESQCMRKIRESGENEMISAFLQTEFYTSRFHQTIGMNH
jgi:hypothetical protein